jgi:hypothetical protein
MELCWNLLELAPAAAAAALRPGPPPSSSVSTAASSHHLTAGDSSNAQVLTISSAPSTAGPHTDGVLLPFGGDHGEALVSLPPAAAGAAEGGGSCGVDAEEGGVPASAAAAGGGGGEGKWVLEGMVVALLQLAGELLATAECKQVKGGGGREGGTVGLGRGG